MSSALSAARSQNGWPVDPPRRSRLVPGTSDVRLTVADGPAGDVLVHVLAQLHTRVESLDLDGARGAYDDWGYANRNVRGSTDISNHASATAVDGNATRHPLGVSHTFTQAQVAEIHQILAEVDHVVRWGGDYTGRLDEMHFEIVDTPEQVARIAARLNQQGGGFLVGLSEKDQALVLTAAKRIMGMLQQRWYKIVNGKGVQVRQNAPGAKACGVLDTLDGSFLAGRIGEIKGQLVEIRAEVAAARGEQIDSDEVRAAVDAELAEFAADWQQISARDDTLAADGAAETAAAGQSTGEGAQA
jgi:hypothetical protein